MKILFTGGSGFIGKNLLPELNKKYQVSAPTRQEMDLRDEASVERYVKAGKFDVILHTANPNPIKSGMYDHTEDMLKDSVNMYLYFHRLQKFYGKMLYFGSGAEYDKSQDIASISEIQAGRSVPKDIYGLGKYIMNELARGSDNIYNLRLFGCYGPYDHESKFITHAIRCCMRGEDITIRQNCRFDYLQVYDLLKVLDYAMNNPLKYHDYNVASGRIVTLEEIAKEVRRQMGSDNAITCLMEGWNREYTASTDRMNEEMHLKDELTSLKEGIEIQIEHERKYYKP